MSLSLTQRGSLRFLWSEQVSPQGADGLVQLEVQGAADRIVFILNDRVLREEVDPVLRRGIPGWTALSVGTFSFKDFTIYQRLEVGPND